MCLFTGCLIWDSVELLGKVERQRTEVRAVARKFRIEVFVQKLPRVHSQHCGNAINDFDTDRGVLSFDA